MMRRILMVLSAMGLMAAMTVAMAAPAFAQARGTATGGGVTAGSHAAVANCQNVAANVINNQPRVNQNITANSNANALAAGVVIIRVGPGGPVETGPGEIRGEDVRATANANTGVNATVNAGVNSRVAQSCFATIRR